MTRSKPISMKKLYIWVSGFIREEYPDKEKLEMEPNIFKAAKYDLNLLNNFIRYVWKHRND